MSGELAHITLFGELIEQVCMNYEMAHNSNHVYRDGDLIQIHKLLHMTFELGVIYNQACNDSHPEEGSLGAKVHGNGDVSQTRRSTDL